jgi:hypothetical protein
MIQGVRTNLFSVDRHPSRSLVDVCKRLDDYSREHVHEDVPDQSVSNLVHVWMYVHRDDVPADVETICPGGTSTIRVEVIRVVGTLRIRDFAVSSSAGASTLVSYLLVVHVPVPTLTAVVSLFPGSHRTEESEHTQST